MVAYNRSVQISFIVVQVGFMLLGGVLIGVGVWLKLEEETYEAVIDSEQFLYGPYITGAAGCAVILVAIIGFVGACWDSRFNRIMLAVYIVAVLVVLGLQLAGGVVGFIHRDMVLDKVRDGLNSTLPRYNGATGADRSITTAWDKVQEQLECCGISGVAEWLSQNSTALDLPGGFPASCCESGTVSVNNTCDPQDAFDTGCEDAVTEFIKGNLLVVASLGISFVVGEVVVMLMAVCLLCCTDFNNNSNNNNNKQ